jgi:hypothetical protein
MGCGMMGGIFEIRNDLWTQDKEGIEKKVESI